MGDETLTLIGLIAMPDAATLTAIGTGVGAMLASFVISLRASWRTKEIQAETKSIQVETKNIRNEIEGPGQEPSMRQMIRDGNEAALNQSLRLHADIVILTAGQKELTERVKMIESAAGNTVIATTLSSLNGHIVELTRHTRRLRFNIHHVANATHVKLFSEEEIEALIAKEETDQIKSGTLPPS